jgi:CARDB
VPSNRGAAELIPDWVAGSGTPPVGENLIYHARVRNTGDRDAENVSVRIDIPGLMDVDNFGGGNLQCAGVFVDPNSRNRRVSCFAMLIPAAGESTTAVTVHINNPFVSDGSQAQLMITADPGNTVPERDKSNNHAPLLVTIRSPADLQLFAEVSLFDDWWPQRVCIPIVGACMSPSGDPFSSMTVANLHHQNQRGRHVPSTGPVTACGTKRTCRRAASMSHLGGKVDIARC